MPTLYFSWDARTTYIGYIANYFNAIVIVIVIVVIIIFDIVIVIVLVAAKKISCLSFTLRKGKSGLRFIRQLGGLN